MTYEEFDAMLERDGNTLVKKLAHEIANAQLTVEQAAKKAAHWHVRKMRKRYKGLYPALHYQGVYDDLYKTGLRDFPVMVHNIKLGAPPFDDSHKPIEAIIKEQNAPTAPSPIPSQGTMKLIPFEVTDNDYWVSFPLEGLTIDLLALGIRQHTGFWLYPSAFQPIMSTVERERPHPCKYCNRRLVRRLFLILTPQDNHRLRAFIVCETCADQMKQDVAG